MKISDIQNDILKIAKYYNIAKPYIVGGIPRDISLGMHNLKTLDIDITTNSSECPRLGILFANYLNLKFVLHYDNHVTVFTPDYDIDFSSAFVSKRALNTLNKDQHEFKEAFSRDFTINTLLMDMETGEILDPTNMGLSDIKNKILRTPVSANITLSDDPRRIYRAIYLSVKYDLTIDDEIVQYSINNKENYIDPGTESIRPVPNKYISNFIDKSFKINPEKTIDALKKLNLYDLVPLTGSFKEYLIDNHKLNEYLNFGDLVKVNKKIASVAPKSWEEYEKIGPEFKMLKDWWISNSEKIGLSSNYDSFTKWYMNNYRGIWGKKHKSPQQVIELLNQNGIDNNIITEFKEEPKDEIIYKEVSIENLDGINVPMHVNILNTTNKTKMFLKDLSDYVTKNKLTKPFINSAFRTVESQVKIMFKNWKTHGSMNGGRHYLVDLYSDDYGSKMSDIFEKYSSNGKLSEEGLSLGISIASNKLGGHTRSPANAIDFAVTKDIVKILNTVKKEKGYNLKIDDETKYKNKHYHVTIKD